MLNARRLCWAISIICCATAACSATDSPASVGAGGTPSGLGGAMSTGTGGALPLAGSSAVAGSGGAAAGAANTGGAGASGAGGSSASGGTGGSSGSSGNGGNSGAGVGGRSGSGLTGCPKFASGLNVAWLNFARDVPNPDIGQFTTLFQNTASAGGRVVRWWFHTNGTSTPGYDGSGLASKISDANIADVKKILDAAHAQGVMIDLSLWSFDMLQSSESPPLANNTALLTQDVNRQAYIDNVLTPLVTALKGYPGLYSWEVFNEPEGMTNENGWTPNKVPESVIQKCVNWFADAIHNADPNARVTNGAWTFIANSTVGSYHTYYSDAALIAAGGRAKGTLDFYEVHYYDNWGAGNDSTVVSPFKHPATYWNVDKPIIIGEFWAADTNGVAAANLYTTLYDNGYNGAWAWQYSTTDPNSPVPTKWPAMQAPMQALYSAHKADLDCP